MPETIAAVLARLGTESDRFDDFRKLLGDADRRLAYHEYVDEMIRRKSARYSQAMRDRAEFYAELVAREYKRGEGNFEQHLAADAVDAQLDRVLSAVDISLGNDDTEMLFTFAKCIAFPMELKSRYEEGAAIYQRILAKAEAAGNLALKVFAGVHCGSFLTSTGHYQEAYDLLAKTRQLADGSELKHEKVCAFTHNCLGIVNRHLGRLADAEKCFNTSLVLCRTLNHTMGIAASLGNLGTLMVSKGDYDRANELFTKSLGVSREIGNQYLIAASLHNVAYVACRQARFDEAQSLTKEALRINKEIGNRQFAGNNLFLLGNLCREHGRLREAEEYYEQCTTLFRETGQKHSLAQCLCTAGILAYEREEYGRARELLIDSIEQIRAMGIQLDVALAQRCLCEIAIVEEDYSAAEDLCEKALTLSRTINDLEGTADALLLRAALCQVGERLEQEAESLREALLHCMRLGCLPMLALSAIRRCAAFLAALADLERSMLMEHGFRYHVASTGLFIHPRVRQEHDALQSRLQTSLPEEELESIKARAESMSIRELADYALDALEKLKSELDTAEPAPPGDPEQASREQPTSADIG